MIIKHLLSTDRVRNHAFDGSVINNGSDTNGSFIFAATYQIGGKKGVTDK
jgi:hypothetical protein